MTIEPDFVAQTGDCATDADRLKWCTDQTVQHAVRGATYHRLSYEKALNLCLYEGWRVQPPQGEEGEPRWQLHRA